MIGCRVTKTACNDLGPRDGDMGISFGSDALRSTYGDVLFGSQGPCSRCFVAYM